MTPIGNPSIPRRLVEHAVRFNGDDIAAASRAWRCTCGPVAIACILDLTLDEVRPLVGSDYLGFMNPTQMRAALDRAGVTVTEQNRDQLFRPTGPRRYGSPIVASYGITRIQFGGPWTQPGVPPRVAYRYTHWVASAADKDGFPDIHDNNWGWMGFGEFFVNMDDLATEIPKASGEWWPTHIYEVEFPAQTNTVGSAPGLVLPTS